MTEPVKGRVLPEEVVVLALCEAARVHLRPDTLYRFEVDPDCQTCRIEEQNARLPDVIAPASPPSPT